MIPNIPPCYTFGLGSVWDLRSDQGLKGRPLLKVSEMIKFLNLTESYLAQFKDGDNNAYLAVITWLRTNIYSHTVPSILSCAVQGSYTKSA